MGLFGGGTKVSSASAAVYSGLGLFQPENDISYKKPIVDLTKPSQVIAIFSLTVIGLYAWKRFRK